MHLAYAFSLSSDRHYTQKTVVVVVVAAMSHNPESEDKKPRFDETQDSDGTSTIEAITALVVEDHKHEIKLRTMSWQKAAWLLAGDQVCLAIMSQSWSLS